MTQVNYLRKFMSKSGCPRYIRNEVIKHLYSREKDRRKNVNQEKESLPVFFVEYQMQVHKVIYYLRTLLKTLHLQNS